MSWSQQPGCAERKQASTVGAVINAGPRNAFGGGRIKEIFQAGEPAPTGLDGVPGLIQDVADHSRVGTVYLTSRTMSGAPASYVGQLRRSRRGGRGVHLRRASGRAGGWCTRPGQPRCAPPWAGLTRYGPRWPPGLLPAVGLVYVVAGRVLVAAEDLALAGRGFRRG
jgi:hypothetical protein